MQQDYIFKLRFQQNLYHVKKEILLDTIKGCFHMNLMRPNKNVYVLQPLMKIKTSHHQIGRI